MSKLATLFLLPLFVSITANASAENKNWSEDQAILLPEGRFETGIFSPLRYGLNKNIELETHPLAFFIIPNVAAKIALSDQANWKIASKHSIHIPTFLLRVLSREGSGGVLPVTSEVPFMLGIGTGIVATTQILEAPHFLSVEAGFVITPKFGESDFPEIEAPILYLRTASYHDTVSVKGSLTLQGEISDRFYYSIQQTGILAPNYNGAFSLEQTAKIMWRLNQSFELMVGAETVLTRYPRQTRLNIFPLFDARFGF